jgi:FkbM family methyltransferase
VKGDGWKNPLRRIRWMARSLVGRDVWYPRQIRRRTERLGSEYGGWTICPENLRPDSIVYCAGVGFDVSFDVALIEKYGVCVHAFDPTPIAIAHLKTMSLPLGFRLNPWGLASFDGIAHFAPPEREGWESFSMVVQGGSSSAPPVEAEVKRVGTIMRLLGHSHIDLLKIDIEGAEYSVIDDILSSKIPINQLLVEFHHGKGEITPSQTRKCIEALKSDDYRLFNVSPVGREYSFLRVPPSGVNGSVRA